MASRGGAIAVLLAAVAAVMLLHWPHGPPLGWDDHGQYLSHARAIAEGRAYTDIGFIYTTYNNFIGPVAEPPGVPVLLAPLLALPGDSMVPVRGLVIVALAGFLALAWLHLSRRHEAGGALAAVLWSLAVFSTLHAFDAVLADFFFSAAIWGVLVLSDATSPWRPGRLATIAALGAVAFAFRLAALPLVPAMALFALTRPRGERGPLLLVSAVWTVVAALTLFAIPTSSALGPETTRSLGEIATDIGGNLLAIREGVLLAMLYPFGANLADDFWHVVAGVLTLLGAWSLRSRVRFDFATWFVIAYVGMLLVLPTRSARYWWPLIPLQALALVQGARVVGARWRTPAGTPFVAAALSLVCIAAVVRQARERAAPLTARPEFRELVRGISGDAAPDSARIVFFGPRAFTWETRIPAMGYFQATPEATLAELRRHRITHLVLGSYGELPSFDASLSRAVDAFPEAFERLGDYGPLVLFRVRP
jgi:hypothetical protein